jgi:nucleoside-diphosphate-sugar epimerase
MRLLHLDVPRELSHSLRPWRRDLFRAAASLGASYQHLDLNFVFWRWLLRAPDFDGFLRLADLSRCAPAEGREILDYCSQRIGSYVLPQGAWSEKGLQLEPGVIEFSESIAEWSASEAVQRVLSPWLELVDPAIGSVDVLSVSAGAPEEVALAAAVTAYVRERYPQIHVCLSHHRWENFSLKPRLRDLITRGALLRMFDSVVLHEEGAEASMRSLLRALQGGQLAELTNMGVRIDGEAEYRQATSFVNPEPFGAVGISEARAIQTWLASTCLPAGKLLVFEALVRNDCHYGACTFCAQNAGYVGRQHYKFAPELRRSLALVRHLAGVGVRAFSFVDQAIHPKLLVQVVDGLAGMPEGARWCMRTLPDQLPDTGLLERAAAAGCGDILLGLESTNPETLAAMGKNPDFQEAALHTWIDDAASFGIGVTLSVIRGFPAEPDEVYTRTTQQFLDAATSRHSNVEVIRNDFVLFEHSPMANQPEKHHLCEVRRNQGDLAWILDYTDVCGRSSRSSVSDQCAVDQLAQFLGYNSIGLVYRWQSGNSLARFISSDTSGQTCQLWARRDVVVLGASGLLGRMLSQRLPSDRLVMVSGHKAFWPALDAPHLVEDLMLGVQQLLALQPRDVWLCARPDTEDLDSHLAFMFNVQRLLDRWARSGYLKRLVLFSTQLVSATPDDGHEIGGDAPLAPEKAYDCAKAQLEVFAGYLHRAYDLDVDVVRLPLVWSDEFLPEDEDRQFLPVWRSQLGAGSCWQFGSGDERFGSSWVQAEDLLASLLSDTGSGLRVRCASSGRFTYAQLQQNWGALPSGAATADSIGDLHLPRTCFFLSDEMNLPRRELPSRYFGPCTTHYIAPKLTT